VWPQLLERVSDAPFLRPKTASHFVRRVNPSNPNGEAPLAAPDDSSFSPDYVARMVDLGRSVDAVESMLPPDDLTARDLRRRLYTATAPGYQFDPLAGTPWLDSVDASTSRFFTTAAPVGSTSFTFTSSEGKIPIQFGDPGPTPLQIRVELQSSNLTFPRDNPQNITLDRPGIVADFPVIAQGSGESTISVLVQAPDGQTINTSSVTVRSTAVNRIALLVTAGAGLGLVLLYARRWLRRRRNATT
jgi:hypothetical protein